MFKRQTETVLILIVMILRDTKCSSFSSMKYVECGQYGFTCEGPTKVRLCDGDRLFGPVFSCPADSICNEDSVGVCDNAANYLEPSLSRTLRCHRNERVVDPSVPGCKGYILCIPNKNRFQGIKFKCSGNTIFNGVTRTCSAPNRYKCPFYNSPSTTPNIFDKLNVNRESIDRVSPGYNRPIDCKSYKFAVTQDESIVRATYFCPARPVIGESRVRCTVFSNHFCITLDRDDPDQFVERAGAAYRRPRVMNPIHTIL